MKQSFLNKRLLKFSVGNAKLDNQTLVFSISAGLTCPQANKCHAWVSMNTKTNKRELNRGKQNEFTCFAASEELRYPNVYKSRKYNLDLIKEFIVKDDLFGLTNLINESIEKYKTKNITKVRIHASGDFFSKFYRDAWFNVADLNKNLIFYCYSKSLDLFASNVSIPSNFYMTASYGSKLDKHILQGHFKRYAIVVYSQLEADKLGLKIDKDDSLCLKDKPFALLLHGMQKKDSEAAIALKVINRNKKQLVKV